MTVLLDVCHPSTEIKLLDVVDAVHLASNTLPQGEVCTRGLSVLNGYFNFPKITSSKLLTVLGSFTSPRYIVTLSTTSPTSVYRPLSPKSLRRLSLSWLWRNKGEAPPCLYRNSHGDWEQLNTCSEERVWYSGTFHTLSLSQNFLFSFPVLFLGFTVIDYYPYWIRYHSPVYNFLVCSSSEFQNFCHSINVRQWIKWSIWHWSNGFKYSLPQLNVR